jgi:Protein of unknown function (DUF1549)/Protein of unknown function (DUF1553)
MEDFGVFDNHTDHRGIPRASRLERTAGSMAHDRRSANGWLRLLAILAVTLSIVGGSFADDQAKAKLGAKRPEGKLPEVVRTEAHEDVDGHTRKASPARKVGSGPTLQPAQIDELIEKGLAATKTPVAQTTSDEEFVRRVYIDVLGRLPHPGQIREFVNSRARNKRALLIDDLLKQPEYADNWARYWRDVISYRSPNENDRQVNYPMFEKWLAEEFAANKPWDKIATEIITATGRVDQNGAAVFAVAEEGSPVEMAGEVSRVFLGIQIQCAQCHDHPSDPWKRQQFHEFAAFFSGVKSKRVDVEMAKMAEAEKGKAKTKKAQNQAKVFKVSAEGATHYTMPDLKNPEKKIAVSPRFFLNDAPKVSEQVKADARLTLVAQYITDPENPWFARAFINRIWYSLMGEGFYNPVDDLGPTRTPNSPEILDLVAEQWQASGYDVHWLFRTILNTQAYQRASRSTNTAEGRTPFASNVPSRLRADQIFDALTNALDRENERGAVVKGPAAKAAKAAERTGDVPGRDVVSKTFGVDPSTPNDDVLGTIPQALYLMNSALVSREVQARPNTMLGYILMTHPDNRAVLELLYLRVLGRRPTEREVRTCSNYLHSVGDRGEAFEDVLWALINSTEFVSRR